LPRETCGKNLGEANFEALVLGMERFIVSILLFLILFGNISGPCHDATDHQLLCSSPGLAKKGLVEFTVPSSFDQCSGA
jgi:hypothetical protein